MGYSAQDGVSEGFETYIIKEATRAVNPEDEKDQYDMLANEAGVKVVSVNDLLR